jgi:hypothetical protein
VYMCTLQLHCVQVATGTCFVRLDFHSFSLHGGHDGECRTDWLGIIGAGGGEERIGGVCGERSGHASKDGEGWCSSKG